MMMRSAPPASALFGGDAGAGAAADHGPAGGDFRAECAEGLRFVIRPLNRSYPLTSCSISSSVLAALSANSGSLMLWSISWTPMSARRPLRMASKQARSASGSQNLSPSLSSIETPLMGSSTAVGPVAWLTRGGQDLADPHVLG